MHFEILVEDLSGKRALDILMPKFSATSIHSGFSPTGASVEFLPTSEAAQMQEGTYCSIGFQNSSEGMEKPLLDTTPAIPQQ